MTSADDGPPVRLGVLLWTERTSWSSVQRAAQLADSAGVDSIWLSDHLFAATGEDTDPSLEAWTALAALAAATEHATIGPLVAAVGLRNPGVTAKMLTTLDHISAGRSVLGLGSGWLAREFTAYGIPWQERAPDRIAQLDEAIVVIQALLRGEVVSHHGRFYDLDAASLAPRPVQEHVPILIGGEGRKHTLALVARRADLWNARGGPAALLEHDAVLREHCAAVGRDPATIERLTNRWIAVRGSRAEAEAALRDSLAGHGITTFDEEIVALGPLDEVAERLAVTLETGFRHLVLTCREPFDLETIGQLGQLRALLV